MTTLSKSEIKLLTSETMVNRIAGYVAKGKGIVEATKLALTDECDLLLSLMPHDFRGNGKKVSNVMAERYFEKANNVNLTEPEKRFIPIEVTLLEKSNY